MATSYLPDSRILEVGNIFYAPTSHHVAIDTKGGRLSRDTVESGPEEAQEKSTKNISIQERAALPKPSPLSSPNELMALAEAFVKAFSAMDNGIITQNNDYVQMQKLDQEQTQAVLQSSTNAIKKEEKTQQLATQLSNYEMRMAEGEKIFGWLMFGIGIALMIVTIASGFVEAAPEEMEMLDMGGGDLGEELDSDTDLSDVDENGTPNYMNATQEMMTDTNEETEETAEDDLNRSDNANTKSEESWKTRWGKRLLRMGIAAGFGSPMLMQGIVKVAVVAPQLNQLAQDQTQVGQALDTMQRNNMYFQFLQQLIQREGSVLQDETSGASQVVDTYSSITSAYRGITYGLANAV